MSHKIPLSLVTVASPCTASWDEMSGDDTSRFCGHCSQYVYNLSAMTETAAQAMIADHEGRMCVRFYRRADGTMMTKDCPVGLQAFKRRVAMFAGAGVAFGMAAFSLLTLGVFATTVRGNGNGGVRFVNPVQLVRDWFNPPVVQGDIGPPPGFVPPVGGGMVMGEMCPPDLPPAPPIQEQPEAPAGQK